MERTREDRIRAANLVNGMMTEVGAVSAHLPPAGDLADALTEVENDLARLAELIGQWTPSPAGDGSDDAAGSEVAQVRRDSDWTTYYLPEV